MSTALRCGNAAREIVDYAHSECAALIALATHGHSGLTRLLRGSVAEKVLHMTATPLLLMRPDGASAAARTPTHILVPLDGSALAESALATAEMLARRLEVPIVLVRVVEVPVVLVGDPVGELFYDYGRLLDEVSNTAKAYVSRIAQALRDKGLQVSVETPAGAAALEIERHTERIPARSSSSRRTGAEASSRACSAASLAKCCAPTCLP